MEGGRREVGGKTARGALFIDVCRIFSSVYIDTLCQVFSKKMNIFFTSFISQPVRG